MSATMIPGTSITGTTIGEVLAPLHERWLAALQTAVGPALLPTSSRWDRWTAVRYVRDELAERLAQERKLVRGIPGLKAPVLIRLEATPRATSMSRVKVSTLARVPAIGSR